MPSDVTAVADRQIQCWEWMTLEITDEGTDRAAELALTRLRCDRLAADMTSLRNKYSKYSQSPATLHAFDVAGISGLDGMLARAKAELEGLRPLVRGSYAPSNSRAMAAIAIWASTASSPRPGIVHHEQRKQPLGTVNSTVGLVTCR
jgi:hypothetical protein